MSEFKYYLRRFSTVLGFVLVASLFIDFESKSTTINAPNGLTVQVDGNLIGVATTLNLQSGNGIKWVCGQTGMVINCFPSIDTAYILSRTTDQSGTNKVLLASLTGAASYTAVATPTMSVYTPNQQLTFVPNVPCPANATLQVDTLGPIPLKKISSGGLVNIAANDCLAGLPYPILAHGSPTGVDAFILRP